MEGASKFLSTQRVAAVTGANKGIGLEICRQLASMGLIVVLTARDEERGIEAIDCLKKEGLSDYLIFHKLDVRDPVSVASLAEFIKSRFGKLDILVNNAATIGVRVDTEALALSASHQPGGYINWNEVSSQTYELAVDCLKTNYYGAKRTVEELVPLLQQSDSGRIVNVSSLSGKLKFVGNTWAQSVLGDTNRLTLEKVDEVLHKFLRDFKEGLLENEGWPSFLSAYTLSKAALNAFTRILARTYPELMINSVCPGYVKTDINFRHGVLSAEQGAESPVWLALLPKAGPSGLFFSRKNVSPF